MVSWSKKARLPFDYSGILNDIPRINEKYVFDLLKRIYIIVN